MLHVISCDKTTEVLRHIYLVDVLNATLKWKFGAPELIFVVNDPVILECPQFSKPADRKPDIILVSVVTVVG